MSVRRLCAWVFSGLLLALIRFYQRALSPHLLPSCRYYPSCSQYAYDSVRVHGCVWGLFLTVKRVVRCHPFARGGYDPVPTKDVLPLQTDAQECS